ncbi:hypothetical protein HHK36_017167 [Tetracentron sinense]|uniref:PH domain-containing protein n=1 Tax=Tetracentron sinense TaxID=13715 RepID=A0A834Z6P6_TETSI|nr:hypothetical protein HHK36_017167 [Tetracentron sinense]
MFGICSGFGGIEDGVDAIASVVALWKNVGFFAAIRASENRSHEHALESLVELPQAPEPLLELPINIESLGKLPPLLESLMEIPSGLESLVEIPPVPGSFVELPLPVFKSGPLFISSKGIGWKSWKKRWFILTRTSLVFFKNDPVSINPLCHSALPPRGGEINLTLGGIDLNNSGSVVVREDKKLLTVLFPDGRDGRAFTLKAESAEDLYEWKTALEHSLAQAPSAALVMGHNGIFRNDTTDTTEGSFHQWTVKHPAKSLVVGRPILLALEDIDGGPSFLEKALRFLEKFGRIAAGLKFTSSVALATSGGMEGAALMLLLESA